MSDLLHKFATTKDVFFLSVKLLFSPRIKQEAARIIANRFPTLLRNEDTKYPYVLFGIHSFQEETLSSDVHIDIAFVTNGFFFSFLPKTSYAFGARYQLEEIFRCRLRRSNDLAPLLPIFVDPYCIVRCREAEQLISYIDRCWHEAVQWGLRQLPAATDDITKPATPDSRRKFLEEVSTHTLFNAFTRV